MRIGELFVRWAVALLVLWALSRLLEYGVIVVTLCFESWRRRRMKPPDMLERLHDELLIHGAVVGIVQGSGEGRVVYWPEQIEKMRL